MENLRGQIEAPRGSWMAIACSPPAIPRPPRRRPQAPVRPGRAGFRGRVGAFARVAPRSWAMLRRLLLPGMKSSLLFFRLVLMGGKNTGCRSRVCFHIFTTTRDTRHIASGSTAPCEGAPAVSAARSRVSGTKVSSSVKYQVVPYRLDKRTFQESGISRYFAIATFKSDTMLPGSKLT